METLFRHEDCDGDEIKVRADEDDPQEDFVILVRSYRGVVNGVRMNPDARDQLIQVLTDLKTTYETVGGN